eukprot:CAMPEP_0202378956 /NCGR_PEP_ID=MMETSP1127-20130417/21621_1 /ASSEMBLY_ACC=CAM_ASM_000462 /TAXON_ID=3047 /ORGANISM="Dunaliella tertiolecta, Strain CCMP1320" /LENGTH=244 /DNA_ID=CAMNT_0048977369 /DNA_START=12 /DNA_END=746 /DNA_ORIENTATION=+
MDFTELALKHLVPSLGIILGTMMYMSPLKAIRDVKRYNTLGEFNTLPLPMIVANTIVWLIYASFIKSPYVAGANLPGLVLGVYMTFVAYGVADMKTRDSMLRVIVVITSVLALGTIAVALFVKDPAMSANAIGYLAVGILLCYYSAPLSALAAVVQSQTSASLHAPLSFMCFMNGALWVAYGLAVGDAFIWGPNGVGALFGAIQLFLLAIFPKSSSTQERMSAQDEVERAPLQQQEQSRFSSPQ